MTALFPDRANAELNKRALAVLERDKKNEADCLFDGAWTGHPDQNDDRGRAVPHAQPASDANPARTRTPDLRPPVAGVGTKSIDGTHAAIRTVIRYRHGYLIGRGASLLDGYMEDLATDRIYRLMIAQRYIHGMHTAARHHTASSTKNSRASWWTRSNAKDAKSSAKRARQSEEMIRQGFHDPI